MDHLFIIEESEFESNLRVNQNLLSDMWWPNLVFDVKQLVTASC